MLIMAREISKLRPRRYPVTEAKIKIDIDKSEKGQQGFGKMSPDHAAAIPHATGYLGMDSYHHYRAMLLAASLPDEPKISISSPTADHPFSAGYSDWDQQIIDRAAQLCGFPGKKLGSRYSEEPEHINRSSPANHNSGKHPK